MSASTSRTWMDRLRSAFAVQDETMFAAALAEAPAAGVAAGSPVVNIHTSDRTGPAAPTADFTKATADALAELTTAVKDLGVKYTALDGKLTALAKTKDEETATSEKESDAEKKREEELKEEARKTTAEAKTGDSAGLAADYQDVIGRAEILVPGVKMPTFDAKAKATATTDALCSFKRQVLQTALTGAGRPHVEAMNPSGASVASMTCDAVGYVFQAASELAKASNNRTGVGLPGRSTQDAGRQAGPVTPAQINERNRNYYKLPA